METVLGLSMTSNSVGWLLLDGPTADAATLDHDQFDLAADAAIDGDITRHESAVRGAQEIAAASGHRVGTVAVTWTDDVEAKAALLLKALPDMGFETVSAVPLPEAARVWAGADGRALGVDRCAVCVVESAAVTVASVLYDTARTARTQMRESADGLGRWLSESFERLRAQPECLYLIGSRGDLELIAGPLQGALHIPVVASEEAQLALARGAALKSAEAPAVPVVAETARARTRQRPARRYQFGTRARAATVLVAGAAALFAVGPELAGQPEGPDLRQQTAADTSDLTAADSSKTAISVHAVPSGPAMPTMPAEPVVAEPLAVPAQPPASPESLPATVAAAPVAEPEVVAEPVAEPVAAPAAAPTEAVAGVEEVEVVEAQPAVVAPAPVTVQPAAATPAPHGPPAAVSLPAPPGPAPAAPTDVTPSNPVPPDPLTAALSPIFGGLP